MSVILITDHNENIYSSSKKTATYHKKEPRYVSRYREPIKLEKKKKKCYSHATMGLPERPLPQPSDFLRKNNGIRHKVMREEPHTRSPNIKAPIVPTATLLEDELERKKKLPPTKNFITHNVRTALKLKPKVPAQRIVINCYGLAKNMCAGMEPVHIYEDGFGKMPEYLTKFIKTRERNLQLKKDSTGTRQPNCRYITREQRDELLAGLKQNWEELQKTYQGLPILTDTIPKMLRKCKLEVDLKQIEKDIVLLERHPYIYVYDDNDLTKS